MKLYTARIDIDFEYLFMVYLVHFKFKQRAKKIVKIYFTRDGYITF